MPDTETPNLPALTNGIPKADPYQGRNDAINALTAIAYSKASMLVLSADEIAKLQDDFPDEAFRKGASGKDALIYIEHAFIRDRMNETFGPGQWAIIPRNRWTEEFTTSNGKQGIKVYVEAMLLIRGCFVAEAVGDMDYWPKNDSTNFGDAVEGAKSAALRRCAKELGIGLQAWKKGWCEEWWTRNPTGRALPRVDTEITEDQWAELNTIAEDMGFMDQQSPAIKEWRTRILKWLGVAQLSDLPASKYTQALNYFKEQKAKRKAGGK